MNALKEFEEIIGYSFNDKKLLKTALTHSSYANENRGRRVKYNERLEFLGDSVLGLIVSKYLFVNYPDLSEGDLTKTRAAVVCEQSLCECSNRMEVGKFLILGKGEEMTGGRTRVSILADAFEAILAAIFLDSGMETAREWALGQLYETIQFAVKGRIQKDYKTALQEYVQGRFSDKIHYEVIGESGPDHKKLFEVNVIVGSRVMGYGEGNSKKNAEQAAAQDALSKYTEGRRAGRKKS